MVIILKSLKWWRKGRRFVKQVILLYEGAQRANADITRTKEEAKAEAEKILKEAKVRCWFWNWLKSIQMAIWS